MKAILIITSAELVTEVMARQAEKDGAIIFCDSEDKAHQVYSKVAKWRQKDVEVRALSIPLSVPETPKTE